jgi:hypothetical protein
MRWINDATITPPVNAAMIGIAGFRNGTMSANASSSAPAGC